MSANCNFLQEIYIKMHCKNIFYDQIKKKMWKLKKSWIKFEKFDDKFDLKLDSNLNLRKFQIQVKLIWIWIWKSFQIGLKFESDLSILFDSFLLVLCEIWVFADLAGI